MNLWILLFCLFWSFSQNVQAATATHYVDNKDGTVTDTVTGITWMHCAVGQVWAGGTCTGSASSYTWDQAVALSANFAGQNDWHLPNIRALLSIVDRTQAGPAMDTTAFPHNPSDYCYSFSTSLDAAGTGKVWGILFADGGDANLIDKSYGCPVRLMRGGHPQSLLSDSRPSADFVDQGNGIVTYTPTGLMWKRCAEGQIWTGSACSGSYTTYTWDQTPTLTGSFAGYSDWRVPSEDELTSLVDYTIPSPGPTINTALFPNTPTSDCFWSASSDASYSGVAWFVCFNFGLAANYWYKTSTMPVRLVRMGSFALNVTNTGTSSDTVTSSPAGIRCGTTCSANYPSGTNVTLTATPGTSSSFSGWSGACSSNDTCTVSMTAAQSVTANFVPITYVRHWSSLIRFVTC